MKAKEKINTKKKITFYTLIFFSSLSSTKNEKNRFDTPIEQMNLTTFYNQSTPKTYLLSYPTSGNTWTRYCLEFLTKRPTVWKYNPEEEILILLIAPSDILLRNSKLI